MTGIIQKHGSDGMTVTKKDSPQSATAEQRGRGRPQLRSDDETRALIFETARHEFAAGGYAATSMDNVARSAGMSTKTLYRLIPNKAALFEAMVTERVDRFASIVKLRACNGGDVEAALTEALIVCAELILDGEVIALQRVILGESDKFPEVAETFYHKAIRRTEDTLAAWLRAQQARGRIEIDDATASAGMLLGMLVFQPMRAVMFGHRPPPNRQEIESRAKICAALFLQGCGRSGNQPPQATP
jgi:AcrR family transcriptional regulator